MSRPAEPPDHIAALAQFGRVDDAGLSDEARADLRVLGARLLAGPGPAWWGVGERLRAQIYAATYEATAPQRPDPDAAAFDGPLEVIS